MNVIICLTMNYENKRNWTIGQSKPNSNPNKPNLKRAKMNISYVKTTNYEQKTMNYEPFTSIENSTLAHFRHFSSLFTLSPLYICRGPSTNRPFYAKQTQFPKSQMNVSILLQTAYENKRDWTIGQSKPNSNPIKPNYRKAKMNVNLTLTKDYRKKDDFAVQQNKPNSNPIKACPERSRMGQF